MKTLKYTLLIAALVGITFFTGCRKQSPALYNPSEESVNISSWSDIFVSYWNGMNNNYVFWDLYKGNWDDIYTEYKPKFEALDLTNPHDNKKAIELFGQLTKNLTDHHHSISLKLGSSGVYTINVGGNEIRTRDYYHRAFTKRELTNCIEANMDKGRITSYFRSSQEEDIDDEDMLDVISYNIDNGIIYFRLSSFDLLPHMESTQDNIVKDVVNHYHKLVMETKNIKGVIIDVRQNGGGYLQDLPYVMGHLIQKDLNFGYSRGKNGPGRLDYGPWTPRILHPLEFNRDIAAPIVILSDIYSISMSEATTMAVRELPNGCFVGERTFGGHGTLNDFELTYAGTFENKYIEGYASSFMVKASDGKCYEGVGITPDIESRFDAEKFANGDDTQLERAIQYIKSRE